MPAFTSDCQFDLSKDSGRSVLQSGVFRTEKRMYGVCCMGLPKKGEQISVKGWVSNAAKIELLSTLLGGKESSAS